MLHAQKVLPGNANVILEIILCYFA